MPLVDSDGRTRHLSDFTGMVLVISDSMTLCQESCPLDTSSVVRAARDVEHAGAGSDVEFLTVTVDPRRDTPHRLAAYRKLYRPAPADWLTLTGSPTDVRALWKAFGVYVKRVPDDSPAPRDWLTGKPLTYDVEHSDEVFFLDKQQHERFIFDGVPHVAGAASIPRTLYQFMSGEGHRNITHPQGGSWTSKQALDVIGWLDRRQVERS
jgi:cytochrome oxidase Cu insertion factor (SCO1/SenC/PrrC family)